MEVKKPEKDVFKKNHQVLYDVFYKKINKLTLLYIGNRPIHFLCQANLSILRTHPVPPPTSILRSRPLYILVF